MALPQINYNDVLVVACNNDQLALKYMNLFLEFAPAEINNINSLLSKTPPNHSALKIAFHTLKPKFGYLGLSAHFELCSSLEKKCEEEIVDHNAIIEGFEMLELDFPNLVTAIKKLISSKA